MTLDIRRAVLGDLRAALPLPVYTTRPGVLEVPSGWLRPPQASSGRLQAMRDEKSALLYLDLWERGEGELDDLYQKLGFMDGLTASFGSAGRIIYREASWTVVREADGNLHGAALWNVSYSDGRATA